MNIRFATETDSMFIYNLRNNKQIRDMCFNTDIIQIEEHTQWLKNTKDIIFIASNNGKDIGVSRFSIKCDYAVISIMILPDEQNKGYGTELIKLIVKYIFNNTSCTKVVAEIKSDNIQSKKAFYKAGFTRDDVMFILK